LIIDIVWRASQLNPWLTLEQITDSVVGVVTIDEIDLHLHPKWQAKAIDIIQTLFPKVQFFITTHSPTVVANFQNGTLYVIEDNQICRHDLISLVSKLIVF
jgi:predicted ATP-binding protein involved in virulence